MDDVQEKRQNHTQQDRSGEREIECGVLAAINDVAWQAPNWKVGASQQEQHNSGHCDDDPKYDQELAKICHVDDRMRPQIIPKLRTLEAWTQAGVS
jgi:hypothetical protein